MSPSPSKTLKTSPLSQTEVATEVLHWVLLQNVPIFEQLQIEEAFLRGDERNICLINIGSPPSIVMGISGHPEELLNLEKLREKPLPVIRRFSGGGTVVVDASTLFVTWIFSKKAIKILPFPEPILRWSCDLYTKAWAIPGFGLRENDYAIYDRKCGGNALYIRKERWLLHTSFLWDYQPEHMQYLLLPKKRPLYRRDRPHDAFLHRLKEASIDLPTLQEALRRELAKTFQIEDLAREQCKVAPSRRSTCFVELNALESLIRDSK